MEEWVFAKSSLCIDLYRPIFDAPADALPGNGSGPPIRLFRALEG